MSPSSVAYALREEYAGTVQQVEKKGAEPVEVPAFSGGLIAIADDRDLDVRAELDAGDGVIVVDETDQAAILALDAYPALKRVDAPEGAEVLGDYEDRTVTELRGELKRRGVTGAGNANKGDAVELLEAFDRVAERGENVPAETTAAELLELADGETPDPDPQA